MNLMKFYDIYGNSMEMPWKEIPVLLMVLFEWLVWITIVWYMIYRFYNEELFNQEKTIFEV